jgi:hypothetical protein
MQDLLVFVIRVDQDSRKASNSLRKNRETKVHLLRMDKRRQGRNRNERTQLGNGEMIE